MKKSKYILIFILTFFIGVINVAAAGKVSCGNVTAIPAKIPELTSFAVTLLQVTIPVILVIMGSLDLFKGITAAKEDEIKKGQHMLIKRLIVAALIFFVVAIVKFVIGLVSNVENTKNMVECIDCFINNDCFINDKELISCKVDGMTVIVDKDGNCSIKSNGTIKVNSSVCKYIPTDRNACSKVGIEKQPAKGVPASENVYDIWTYNKYE